MIKRDSFPVASDMSMLLARWPSKFAEKMLQLSSKPFQNLGVLLGISAVLLELQGVIAEAPNVGLLSPGSYAYLQVLFCQQYHTTVCKSAINIYSQMRGCLWIIRMGMLWRK
jgi:hypothetical protein